MDIKENIKPPSAKGFNTSWNFWNEYAICPVCRGYELEKSWCDHCGKTGYVKRVKSSRLTPKRRHRRTPARKIMNKPKDPEAAETAQNKEALAVDLPRLVSSLEHGTEEEHRATLARAKASGLTYVWSGELRRNRYLAENLRFGEAAGILTTKRVESDYESGWEISWAN